MSGFLVRVIDGPAAGWEYQTAVQPDEEIVVAPNPSEAQGPWMRTLDEEPYWPGSLRYRKATSRGVTTNGPDVVVEYELLPCG